jgi:2-phospho-L-lactate guanylyltransferase (CobY/MobA/RfbA family)
MKGTGTNLLYLRQQKVKLKFALEQAKRAKGGVEV